MLRFVLVTFLMVFVATAQVSAHGAKDPTAALMLALIIPGGGQIYNEQPEKAVIPIGSIVGAVVINTTSLDNQEFPDLIKGLSLLVAGAAWIWSIFDAAMSADKINIEYHRRNRFGHLMEFDGDQVTVEVGPVTSGNRVGTMVSVRF